VQQLTGEFWGHKLIALHHGTYSRQQCCDL
jgi:hypothetical protein